MKVPAISVGSTPAMSQAVKLDWVTEARPGNYAFYDYTQVVLGSCALRDVAVTVQSSVVSTQPGAKHSVIDAGALALSKDAGSELAPRKTMGEILGHEVSVASVSQEPGVTSGPPPVGTRVRIVPNPLVPHGGAVRRVRGGEGRRGGGAVEDLEGERLNPE